jgi:hypothetical protein
MDLLGKRQIHDQDDEGPTYKRTSSYTAFGAIAADGSQRTQAPLEGTVWPGDA